MLRIRISRPLLSFAASVAVLHVLGMAHIVAGQEIDSTSHTPPSISIKPSKLPDDIEQVLWWLPEETEAVVVSKGNVPLRELQVSQPPDNPRGRPTLTFPPGYAYPTYKFAYQDLVAMHCIEPLVYYTAIVEYSGIPDLHDKMVISFYGPKTASLFVKAVWWENDQTRASCDIVVFRDDMAARIVKSFASLPSVPRDFNGVRALKVDLNSGVSSEVYERLCGKPLEADWRYLAAPQPNVYISTTNSQLMNVVVERMKRRSANRALPSDLPEWGHFDPAIPAWGLRHYRPAIAERDKLSMLKRDPNAKGLIFFGGNKPSSFLGLRYVSKSEDSGNRFLRLKADYLNIKDVSVLKPMNRISADCVESRVRSNVSQTEAMRDIFGSCTAEGTFYNVRPLFLWFLGFP